jgi:hypothetical protein
MYKFSWRTMIIFVMVLFLGVILLGLATAYLGKLKQQRRQLSDSYFLDFRAPIEAIVLRQTVFPVLHPGRKLPISTMVEISSTGPKRAGSATRDK